MGRPDPGELERLEAQSQQIVKQTLDHLRQLFAQAGAPVPSGTSAPPASHHGSSSLIEEQHEHRSFAAEWPTWILERIVPENDDSTGLKIAKIGLVIISPVVIGPAALAGFLVDKIVHMYDFLKAADPLGYLSWPLPIDLGAFPQTPTLEDSVPREELDTHTSGVAMDPPPPPPLPEKPRERNKCGAAARRGRR